MALSTDSEGSPFRPCGLLYLPLALYMHHSLAINVDSQQITLSKLVTPIMACTGLLSLMVMLKSGVSHPHV